MKKKKKVVLIIIVTCIVLGFVINIFPYISIFIKGLTYSEPENDVLSFENLSDTTFITNEYSGATKLTIKNSQINDLGFMKLNGLNAVTFENCTYTGEPVEINQYYTDMIFNCCEADFINSFRNIEVNNLLFSRTETEDLTEIASNFKNVNFLGLHLCTIKSMNGIQDFTSLKELVLYGIYSNDISLIENVTSLDALSMRYLIADDISFIKNMNISSLVLDNLHRLGNLDFITEMNSLSKIEIFGCEMACTEKLNSHLNELKNNTSYEINFDENSVETQRKIRNLSKEIVNNGMSNYEKVHAVVSYVCDLISYDMNIAMYQVYGEIDENTNKDSVKESTSQYDKFGLENALNGVGMCLNYTEITTALLNEIGINTYSIVGANHIWNLVEIDDKYLWIDVTAIDCNFEAYESIDKNPMYLAPITDPIFISNNYLFNIPPQIYDDANYAFSLLKEHAKEKEENSVL